MSLIILDVEPSQALSKLAVPFRMNGIANSAFPLHRLAYLKQKIKTTSFPNYEQSYLFCPEGTDRINKLYQLSRLISHQARAGELGQISAHVPPRGGRGTFE